MKKKLIALVTALTLCAVVVVGATLAYFSQQTDDKVNVFTYDPEGGGHNPDPEIKEPNWPGLPDITPGTATPKDPQIVLNDTNTDNAYKVAMIIRGGSELTGKLLKDDGTEYAEPITLENMLKMLDKSVHTYTKTIIGQVENPDYDPNDPTSPEFIDSNNPEHKRTVEVYQNVGLAKIMNWSDDYDYDVDSDGNIYAYYKYNLNDPDEVAGFENKDKTNPIFQYVVTNQYIDHFLKAIITADEAAEAMNIIVTGYVVSAIDDTEVVYENGVVKDQEEWASCKYAMMTAFPAEFPSSELGPVSKTNTPALTAAMLNDFDHAEWPWNDSHHCDTDD